MTLKRFSAFLMIGMTVLLLSLDVSAKKFGSSKSWGKSYRSAPQQQLTQRQAPKSGLAANTAKRPGLMGGVLGGLLAGGLFAWLLGSGVFNGIQFMDVLILAVIAFIGFRLLRGLMQAKAVNREATASYSQPSWLSSESNHQQFGSSHSGSSCDVPFDLPAGFDVTGFLEGARGHYNIIQAAWNQNDLNTIQEYLAPELYQQLVDERAKLGNQLLHNHVLYVDASLVRAKQSSSYQHVSVHFVGKYRDTDGQERAIDEIWHLRRETGLSSSDWLIEGIEEKAEDE